MSSVNGQRRDLVPRHLRPILRGALGEFRAVAIVGARQVGKSTLAQSLIGPDFPAEYRTLDNELLLGAALDDPVGFVEGLPEHAILDEIQRAPDLMLAIKARLDRSDSQGQLLLTGSADLQNLSRIRDALPGRVIYLELWPFSQAEIERGQSAFLEAAFGSEPQLDHGPGGGRKPYARRIVKGGYPEATRLSDRGREQFFQGYVSALTNHVVDEVAGVRDPAALDRLLRLIAARSGQLLNSSRFATTLQHDQKTTRRYLSILNDLFITYELPAWHTNIGQRLTKAPKVYVRDTGMMAHLTGISEQAIVDDMAGDRAGMFFETFAVMEIARQAQLLSPAVSLYHYRDKSDREIDLVIERNDGAVIGVEVKAASTVRSADFAGLRLLRDRLASRFKAGILLHAGREATPFGPGLFALPISSLWR